MRTEIKLNMYRKTREVSTAVIARTEIASSAFGLLAMTQDPSLRAERSEAKQSQTAMPRNDVAASCFLRFLFGSRTKQFSNALVRLRSERAASLAEFVIALPLLVVFVTLTHQVWSTIEVHKALDNTAREAARYASLQLPPMANITPSVQTYVASKLVPNSSLKAYDPSKISVNVERLGNGPTTVEDTVPKGAVNPGDVLRVSVSLGANQPGGFYSYLIGPSTTSIVRSAAYVQANPTEGVAEPTPTPAPTGDPECCKWVGSICVEYSDGTSCGT